MERFILDTHECVYYVDKLKLRGNYIPRRTATLSLNDDGRTAHGRLMLVGGEHVCDVDGNMGSRDSSSQTENQMRRSIIMFEERSQTRERNRQCASVHGCLGGGNPSDINFWWVGTRLTIHLRIYSPEFPASLVLQPLQNQVPEHPNPFLRETRVCLLYTSPSPRD